MFLNPYRFGNVVRLTGILNSQSFGVLTANLVSTTVLLEALSNNNSFGSASFVVTLGIYPESVINQNIFGVSNINALIIGGEDTPYNFAFDNVAYTESNYNFSFPDVPYGG